MDKMMEVKLGWNFHFHFLLKVLLVPHCAVPDYLGLDNPEGQEAEPPEREGAVPNDVGLDVP